MALGLMQPRQVAADHLFSRAMVCCSLLLSLAVEAVFQTVMDDWWCLFFARQLMLCSHWRSWLIVVPRNRKDSTVFVEEPHAAMGVGSARFFLKSSPMFFRALSFRFLGPGGQCPTWVTAKRLISLRDEPNVWCHPYISLLIFYRLIGCKDC